MSNASFLLEFKIICIVFTTVVIVLAGQYVDLELVRMTLIQVIFVVISTVQFDSYATYLVCDWQAKTLTIIQSTQGHLFGGYASVAWIVQRMMVYPTKANLFHPNHGHDVNDDSIQYENIWKLFCISRTIYLQWIIKQELRSWEKKTAVVCLIKRNQKASCQVFNYYSVEELHYQSSSHQISHMSHNIGSLSFSMLRMNHSLC
jgi:hypothetical protein